MGALVSQKIQRHLKIAENVDYDFSLLSSVIQFNNKQQRKLLDQAIKDFGTLEGKSRYIRTNF